MFKNLKNSSFSKIEISKSKLTNIEPFIFAFCLFLLTPPFYVWHSISSLIFISICSLISLKHNKLNNQKHLLFFVVFFIIYLYFFIRSEANIFGIITSLTILTLFIISNEFLNKIFKAYIQVFSISLIPSLIVFTIVYIFKIDLPHSYIEPLNPFKLYNYVQYPFLVQPNIVIYDLFPRYLGYYDEPGVIGTISGVILMSSGFNLKKKINIPIFIAGLLSFSFAFYLITLIYGIIFLRTKYKILLAIVSIGIIILFTENKLLNTYVFSRFNFENGKFAGDNRDDGNFETFYGHYSKSVDYYFGIGQKASSLNNKGGASYKDLIVSYGIFGFASFLALLILFG